MNKQTPISSIVYSFLLASFLLLPVNAVADSKTLPGSHCDPESSLTPHAKINGHIVNTSGFIAVFTCAVLRDLTNDAPIKRLQVVVLRPFGAPGLFCNFISYTRKGGFIAVKSRSAPSTPNIVTLSVKNLQTSKKGIVEVVCVLPIDGEIRSIFWNE